MDSHSAHSIPDTLFSYLGVKGIAVLENLELMFSNPADFNDPFEFLPHLKAPTIGLTEESCGDERTSMVQKLVRIYTRNSFIFCMTDEEHNVRMWDHYGEKNQGLMISLDFGGVLAQFVEQGCIFKVDYSRETRAEPLGNQTQQDQMRVFKDTITRKGKDWAPESEFRWILDAERCSGQGRKKEPGLDGELRLLDGKMKAFLPIPAASIRKVTVGYYSSPSLLRTVLQLRTRHNASWTVAKARLSLDGFKFEDEPVPL